MRIRHAVWMMLVLATPIFAQRQPEIIGSWYGVSLCVDKATDTACKDEVVLYRISPDPSTPGRANFDAWKIVGRDTVSMGSLVLIPAAEAQSWDCELQTPRFHGRWSFTTSGRALAGTLIDLPSKRLIRRVATERVMP